MIKRKFLINNNLCHPRPPLWTGVFPIFIYKSLGIVIVIIRARISYLYIFLLSFFVLSGHVKNIVASGPGANITRPPSYCSVSQMRSKSGGQVSQSRCVLSENVKSHSVVTSPPTVAGFRSNQGRRAVDLRSELLERIVFCSWYNVMRWILMSLMKF